jgi:Ca2+:H+ antiporter
VANGGGGSATLDEVRAALTGSRLNLLLAFVPLALAADLFGLPGAVIFAASALAIVPLAGLIGEATEQIAHRVGAGVGGLLNATLGNLPELIIGLFALSAGLHGVVKASISGSLIANVLLVLGLSILIGGWGRVRQRFSRIHAGASTSMLFLAVVALVMPAVFDLAVFGSLGPTPFAVQTFSLLVAIVLMATYLAGLVFSLKTHRDLITSAPVEAEIPAMSLRTALVLLAVLTVLTAVESELLVGSITEATRSIGVTDFFVGVVVVAIVGNAAEHASAVMMAKKDKMDLAIAIAAGSSAQVALFVAPVLVFASLLFGQPLSLVFNAFEIVGVILAVLALALVVADGESNWFEGLQLLAIYAILVIVFFFVPDGS